jgi:hypothetical protein
MNKTLDGKWIILNANGKVKTLADLDKICELMARSLTDNADCTMAVEKQGPFTLAAWQSYVDPHYAEGFDKFRMVPDRWHAKAIAMIRQHIAAIGPSHSALAMIHADRLAAINS